MPGSFFVLLPITLFGSGKRSCPLFDVEWPAVWQRKLHLFCQGPVSVLLSVSPPFFLVSSQHMHPPIVFLSSVWIGLPRNDTSTSVTHASLTDSSNLNKLRSTKCMKMTKWQQFYAERLHFVYFSFFPSRSLFHLFYIQFTHILSLPLFTFGSDLYWNILTCTCTVVFHIRKRQYLLYVTVSKQSPISTKAVGLS